MHDYDMRSRVRSTNPTLLFTTLTQWLLLAAAATFGSLFAYNTLSPISTLLAALVAVSVIGLNIAEGYLVRFVVASWRFGFNKLVYVAGFGALIISAYSLLAGSQVVESYLVQNQQVALATDYDIAAAQQRIQAARSRALNAFDVQQAEADYLAAAAQENQRIATLGSFA